MKKKFITMVLAGALSVGSCMTVLAATQGNSYTTMAMQTTQATFSSYWYQDSTGAWHIKDGSGNQITNAWVCDNAIQSNGSNVWYLIDGNGNMITSGLVQDQTGNYYSLEMNHNGYYGMLRHESGNYDGISLTLNQDHAGSFASIQNQDGIKALQSKYGLAQVGIGNSNIVYTADFGKGSGNSGAGVDTGKGNSSNQNGSHYDGSVLPPPIPGNTQAGGSGGGGNATFN